MGLRTSLFEKKTRLDGRNMELEFWHVSTLEPGLKKIISGLPKHQIPVDAKLKQKQRQTPKIVSVALKWI